MTPNERLAELKHRIQADKEEWDEDIKTLWAELREVKKDFLNPP